MFTNPNFLKIDQRPCNELTVRKSATAHNDACIYICEQQRGRPAKENKHSSFVSSNVATPRAREGIDVKIALLAGRKKKTFARVDTIPG